MKHSHAIQAVFIIAPLQTLYHCLFQRNKRYFPYLRGDWGWKVLHALHIRLCLGVSHALENYLRAMFSPPQRGSSSRRKLHRFKLNEGTSYEPKYFACRSLHPITILPKILLSFIPYQKISALPPSWPSLNNRLQLGQHKLLCILLPETSGKDDPIKNHSGTCLEVQSQPLTECHLLWAKSCNWKYFWSNWNETCCVTKWWHTPCTHALLLALGSSCPQKVTQHSWSFSTDRIIPSQDTEEQVRHWEPWEVPIWTSVKLPAVPFL